MSREPDVVEQDTTSYHTKQIMEDIMHDSCIDRDTVGNWLTELEDRLYDNHQTVREVQTVVENFVYKKRDLLKHGGE